MRTVPRTEGGRLEGSGTETDVREVPQHLGGRSDRIVDVLVFWGDVDTIA
jgi:hypothetical protein